MSRGALALFALLPFFASIPAPAFAVELELPPLLKEGTPGESLMQDPVAPAWEGQADPVSGSGTLQGSLSDQAAFQVIGTAAPGANTQLRGLGRSAEATSVQALGVPLNPGQGGGFDLSIFPQFIWSSYQFQPGPALGTFDPRGTAGSLILMPWSAQALLRPGAQPGGRATVLGSSADLFQVSAAATDGAHVAAVAGTSAGSAQGPSAALSARYALSESEVASFHVLATDLDVRTPGPAGLTPFAHQLTARVIPLLQLDSKLAGGALLKASVFADDEYLRYQDPSSSALPTTQDHIFQGGTEDAFLAGDWKLGLALRGVQYHRIGSPDEQEAVGDAALAWSWDAYEGAGAIRSLLIEPSARAVMVSAYGALPEASLGARLELGEQTAVYARGGLSWHFPSMVNRYYSYPGFPGYPGFAGNPGLQPEDDWTAVLGLEWGARELHARIEGYAQYADNAQVRAPSATLAGTDTELNLGYAEIVSLLLSARWSPAAWLDVDASATVSGSQLSVSGLAFPGQPLVLGVGSVAVHSIAVAAGGRPRWEAKAIERTASTAVANTGGGTLPAYHEENLEASYRFASVWEVAARVDDLTDQQPVLVAGYPGFGTTGSVLVQREF